MKMHNRVSLTLVVAALLVCAMWFLWPPPPADSLGKPARKVRFYQDSMHPWVKLDGPGKCTICSMDLTPVYEGDKEFGVDENTVVLSRQGVTVMHVETEEVSRRTLLRTLRVAGTLEANEGRKSIVSAPAPARIQAMAVEYAGVEVEKGQRLVTLFSPELVQKAGYFRAIEGSQAGGTKDATAPKVGVSPFTSELLAPQSGVVTERNAYQGQFVAEGEKLLTIADASSLWFRFDVYERQLPWLEPGQTIKVSVPALPGQQFAARIEFVDPALNEATSTVKVRADLANPAVTRNGRSQRLLRFGMFAEGQVRAEIPEVLAIPRTAVLFPGSSAYVFVDNGGGAYERRRVVLGRQGDDFWEVLAGVDEGDRVVTSGNVLIDAQSQMNGSSATDAPEERSQSSMVSSPEADVVLAAPMKEEAADPEPAQQAVEQESRTASSGASSPSPDRSPVVLPAHVQEVHGRAEIEGNVLAMPAEEKTEADRQRASSRRQSGASRMAVRDELWRMRLAAMAEARDRETQEAAQASNQLAGANSTPLPSSSESRPVMALASRARLPSSPALVESKPTSEDPRPVEASSDRDPITALVNAADRLGHALAADDLEDFRRRTARLAELTPFVEKTLTGEPTAEELRRQWVVLQKADNPKDLAEARRQFLPYSTATTEWVKRLRKQRSEFATLRVYHCPMAPKPGLWMQVKGPLANPYYGAKMLTCGEEVAK